MLIKGSIGKPLTQQNNKEMKTMLLKELMEHQFNQTTM